MIDETNFCKEEKAIFEIQTKQLQKIFERRRITFHSCKTKEDALKVIKKLILSFLAKHKYNEIAFSDSATLHQIGVYEMVSSLSNIMGFRINNPFERFDDGKLKAFGKQPDGKLDILKEEYIILQKKWLEQLRSTLMSDILIIGANAITSKGDIVSTDGAGNRVAGMIFGPRKVIVVVGKNKLTFSIEEAIQRNRNIAAPLNYLRHNLKHHNRYNNPCLQLGYCTDCSHPRRACLNTVIISGAVEANKDRIHIIYVNANLGL